MKRFLPYVFLSFILPVTGTLTCSNYLAERVRAPTGSVSRFDQQTPDNNTVPVTLAEVDAGADFYAPLNHIYSSKEAIALRDHLISQLKTDPQALAVYWALLRYYSNAPDFIGGNTAMALQYAAYIFSINQYLGCLAYEYAYSNRKQPGEAEAWYGKSLNTLLPKDMYWQEIKYNNTAQFGIKVTGNFNNWKLQNMYETAAGNYARKVMVPKCEHCIYKCVVDFTNVTNPSKTSDLTINSY